VLGKTLSVDGGFPRSAAEASKPEGESECISKCLDKLCRGVTRATAHPVFIHWIGLHKRHWLLHKSTYCHLPRLTQTRSCIFLSQKEHYVFSAASRASEPKPQTHSLHHSSPACFRISASLFKRTLMSIKAPQSIRRSGSCAALLLSGTLHKIAHLLFSAPAVFKLVDAEEVP